MKKAGEFLKSICFCFIDYAKAFDCVDHNCGNFFKKWEYQTTWPTSWEICKQVRKKQLELDLKWGKGVCQGWMLSPCLFNLYAEYIVRNTGLDEAQAGIKNAGRNISNLR